MSQKPRRITSAQIERYALHLREQERAPATVQKYLHDLTALLEYLDGAPVTKGALIDWKEALAAAYAPATVNSMLAAVNGFLSFLDRRELAVKPLKIQKALFCDEARELTRAEYARRTPAHPPPPRRSTPRPRWRICWATPVCPPPASTPPRAAPSTPGRWSAWLLS